MQSWGIHDFKSIVSAKLSLGGPRVSIVTGTNSSGKSTLLQSLLLLAQTASRLGRVTLNGPLVRLGAPEDVVREGQAGVAFEIDLEPADARGTQLHTVALRVRIYLAPKQSDFVIDALEVLDAANDTVILEATSSRMNKTDLQAISRQLGDESLSLLRVTVESSKRAPNRMYVVFRGLVPVGIAIRRPAPWIANTFLQAFEYLEKSDRDSPLRFRTSLLSDLSSLVNKRDFLRRQGNLEITDQHPHMFTRWTLGEWYELPEEWKSLLIAEATHQRSSNEWVIVYGDTPSGDRRPFDPRPGIIESVVAAEHEYTMHLLSAIGDQLITTGDSVAYLGPLREAPRVVHSAWDERRESLPVGIRGEFTAEVLTRLQHRKILHRDVSGRRRIEPLPDAVSYWCNFLGIGDDIQVIDHGKLGRGVRLRVGGAFRDLTTIGVGASQLLPVLVAVLTAPRNAILLLEQPELHLHPAVQAKLADFFLQARQDVRLIVETHSEYLLTRLRLRLAEGAASPDAVAVIFVEEMNGIAVPRKLSIDEFGDMSEWPRGFFDAQDDDSLAIMRAVQNKVRNRSGA